MNQCTRDLVTRQTAGVVRRRGALRWLGGIALAGGCVAPATGAAGKERSDTTRKGGKKERCKREGNVCQTVITEYCAGDEEEQACREQFFPCCEHFARCRFGAGIECLAVRGES
jgi:hypothetical protein